MWDSGRLNLVLDNADTRDLLTRNVLPYSFRPSASSPSDAILSPSNPAEKSLLYQESIAALQSTANHVPGAMLLWYHSPNAVTLNGDAPAQLVEFTIRDPSVPVPGTTASFDYDLSYLDAMYLPVALEARGGTDPQNKPVQVGYVGTTDTIDTLEKAVNEFVKGTILHGYFPGGQGWPQYYLSNPSMPINQADLIKIPGGKMSLPIAATQAAIMSSTAL